MYQTSPEDPVQSVARLCHKHSSESVMLGEYSLSGGKVRVYSRERNTHCSCNYTRGLRAFTVYSLPLTVLVTLIETFLFVILFEVVKECH